jgi:hypothetical protein
VKRTISAAVVIGMLALGAGMASADGGQSIAGASAVTVGQQDFGNTATGAATYNSSAHCSGGGYVYDSWWALPVTAGDHVTIDWASQPYGAFIYVYPVGTNDYNVGQATNVIGNNDLNTGPNGKNTVSLMADRDGLMPLDFEDGYYCGAPAAGPYNFTAYVQHAVSVSIPEGSDFSFSGTIAVGVHNPDGVAISDPGLSVQLQIQASGQPWTTVGSATANAGSAAIPYTIPVSLAGQKINVRAAASGPAYVSETSAAQAVTLPAKPAPPKLASANLRLGHVTASRRHGATIQGTTAAAVVGRIYVYASCWKAKKYVIVPDTNGKFAGHLKLPNLCRKAKHVWVGAVWGGSQSFAEQNVGKLVGIRR